MQSGDRFVSRLSRDTMALVLAGGRGSRLFELTTWRAKPAVYFGGKFRIIDFPLSNCVNSHIRRISILTQYRAHSLIRHVMNGWSYLNPNLGEFIDVLPASQQMKSEAWYKGTADAVHQNADIINDYGPAHVLVLAGDHIYKMDYGLMLAEHVRSGADLTVGCLEVPCAQASAFGVMGVDENWRVRYFEEKPSQPRSMPGKPGTALASMGIYVFSREFLMRELDIDAADNASTHDFGRDIIPRIIRSARVFAYPNRDPVTGAQAYWRDVGTIDSFWASNLELLDPDPPLDIYDKEWPILTHQLQLPPAKFMTDDQGRSGTARDSMVSGACIIDGGELHRSVLFSNVGVEAGARLEETVVLPDSLIEAGARVTRAVLDRGCRIPAGMVIGENRELDEKRFRVSDSGIVLVTPEMLRRIPED
jgi:glucose-1-phosphate adenylyltransferase